MSRPDKFALATVFFLLGVSALMQVLLGGDGDKGWLLLAARMWLDGKRLYVDVVEVNPPLIIWLYGLDVWISRHLPPLGDLQVLGLTGLLGCALSVGVCARLIRLHPAFAEDARKRFRFLLLLALIFVFLTPQNFFFDREHILLVMTFPYILRFMPALALQRPSLGLRLAVGALAALGFCIKPHSLILFAALQLLFILRERSAAILWSVENRVVLLLGLLYLACVWRFTPEYLFVIFPMALQTYSSFSRSGSILLDLPPALFCFGLTFADFRRRTTSPYRRDIYYFLGVTLAFLLYAIAGNGWDYTYHPLMCILLFLSGWVFWEYQWLAQNREAQGLPVGRFVFGQRGCIVSFASQGIYMLIVTLGSIPVWAVETRCARSPECLLQDPYVRYVHDHDVHSFGTITLDYPKWVLLTRRTGARWETRFNHLWMLPKVLEQAEKVPQGQGAIARYVASSLADDLTRRKPDIVFVDSGRQFFDYPRYVDLLAFLSRNEQFKAAWGSYRYTAHIDSCPHTVTLYPNAACQYDIFTRVP